MILAVPTMHFEWRRKSGTVIGHCDACPWYISNTGPADTVEVRDKVIVMLARKHVKDCAGQVEEQERAHKANAREGRSPWEHGTE